MSNPELKHVAIRVENKVAHISLNRPAKANAVDARMWIEIGDAFNWADDADEVRAIVFSGEGKNFTGGIDFNLIMTTMGEVASLPDGKKQDKLRRKIEWFQQQFTAIETCRKPVVAAVHGSCYGAGVDLITAADVRLSTDDASFCVKEVDLAIVADVGTLQRLPTIVGEGVARELCLTARVFDGKEAAGMRLVNRTYPDREALLTAATETAELIASKSPVATRGVKQVMNFCRDHSVQAGLQFVAAWNAGVLLSADGQEAFGAMMEKREAKFED